MRPLTLLLALLAATPAAAVPLELTHQGRLVDAAGTPLDGAHTLHLSLYASATDTTPLWTDAVSADLEDGLFTVRLGAGAPLDSSVFDGSPRYLGLAVDDADELPGRIVVVSVPYALRAGAAEQVPWSGISGLPVGLDDGDDDALGALSCADGEIPTWQGGGWACGDASLLAGIIDITALPVGTGPDAVAAGDHTHSAADVGALALEGGTLSGALAGTTAEFSGQVKVGDSSTACDDANAGALRYHDAALQVCTDAGWLAVQVPSRFGRALDAWTLADGSNAASCAAYLASPDYGGEGWDRYWIDPDGASGPKVPFRVWCDMETDGGGWMAWQARNAPWWQDGVTCTDVQLFEEGDLEQMRSVSYSSFRVRSNASFDFREDDSNNPGTVYGVSVGGSFPVVSWHFRGFNTNHMRLNFSSGHATLVATCNAPHSCGVAPNWPAAGGNTGNVILTRIEARPTCDGATASSNQWTRNGTWMRGDHYIVLMR